MAHYALLTIVTMIFFCMTPTSRAQESQVNTSPVTPAQKYLFYAPQPVAVERQSPSREGIIVQEIDIKRGDTLYDLSRKFSGHGMYFPQILLFNQIQNPNLIYPGNKLKVPITKHSGTDGSSDATPLDKSDRSKAAGSKKIRPEIKSVAPARQSNVAPPVLPQNTEISLSELRTPDADKRINSSRRKKTALPTRKITARELPTATPLSAPLPASYVRKASPSRTSDAVSGQKLFEAAVKAFRIDDCTTALELLDRYLADNSGSPLAADANLYKAECYLKLSAQ